jgi:plastocyanin
MINTHSAHRRLLLTSGLASLVIVLGACSSGAASSASASQAASQSAAASATATESAAESSAAGATVTITGTSSFGTAEVTVPAGEKLTVINQSGVSHTFTEGENGEAAADARFDEQIPADGTVKVEFPDPGDYDITCEFHSAMNMVVHVE